MINRKATQDESQLADIMKQASLKFIEGNTANKKSKDEKMEKEKTGYFAIKEASFVRLSTSIPGTHFIATTGPKFDNEACVNDIDGHHDIEKFYDDIVSNNIEEVVALGRHVSSEPYSGGEDFFNYFFFEEGHPEFLRYRVKTELTSEKFAHSFFIDFGRKVHLMKSQVTLSKENDKNEKKFNVTLFCSYDGGEIRGGKIDNDKEYSIDEAILEQLWQLFKKSQNKKILVHCHSGVGRTGHFILIMEILKHFNSIFTEEHSGIIADKIIALIDSMRSVRPGLISSHQQLRFAILFAHRVYQYALAKKYIMEDPLSAEEKSTTTQIVTQLQILPSIAKPDEAKEKLPTANVPKDNFKEPMEPRVLSSGLQLETCPKSEAFSNR